jgi:hypothetical protein
LQRADRLLLLSLAAIYLVIAALSHLVPLPPWLEAPLAVVPWICLVIVGWVGRRAYLNLRAIRLDGLTLIFLLLIGPAFAFSASGNLSDVCRTTCIKFDSWRVSGPHYFRCSQLMGRGHDCRLGWIEIPRYTYITEVGSRLRESMTGGLLFICVSWILTWRTSDV